MSERHQRLLAPTVGLRLAWLGAIAAALCSGALLVRDAPDGVSLGVLVYLTATAIVPLAAVTASLSTASEPAPEIAVAAPIAAAHVTGLRACAVLVVTVTIALPAGVLLPGPWTETALWLLPSLAMCSLATVLSGRVGPVRSGSAVAFIWACGVGVWVATTDDRLAPFRSGPQLVYLTIAALGAGLLVRHPHLMEPTSEHSVLLTNRSTP